MPGEPFSLSVTSAGVMVALVPDVPDPEFGDRRPCSELEPPALRIMTWLEHNRNAEHTHRLIGELGARSLDPIGRVTEAVGPLEVRGPRPANPRNPYVVVANRSRRGAVLEAGTGLA